MIVLLTGLAMAAGTSTPELFKTGATVTTLPNGLTVVVEEQRRTDVVALHLRYGVGSRDQGAGQGGTAHLFEHLMFEGSAHVPQNMFDTWLTTAGGQNNAWTSSDETAYHMTFPSGALDLGLFLESDRMGFLDAGLTEENLKNQQDVVLRERAEGYAAPHGRDWDALTVLLYPEGHPYHSPVIGTEADIRGFSLEATQAFWQAHYRPRNAVLAVVGNVSAEAAVSAVSRWFGDVPDPGPATPRGTAPSMPDRATNGLLEDAVEDWTLYVAWPGPTRFSAEEPALDLLMEVLSGGRGTRLDDALYYEGKLATEVWGGFFSGDLGGPILLVATAPKPSLKKIAKKMDRLLDEIARTPPTPAELERARIALLSGLLDQLEEPAGRANWLADCQAAFGRPDCLPELWSRFQAVTPEDVSKAAATWMVDARRVTLSVVPQDKGGALPGAERVELR